MHTLECTAYQQYNIGLVLWKHLTVDPKHGDQSALSPVFTGVLISSLRLLIWVEILLFLHCEKNTPSLLQLYSSDTIEYLHQKYSSGRCSPHEIGRASCRERV